MRPRCTAAKRAKKPLIELTKVMKNISFKRIFFAVALICVAFSAYAQFTFPAESSDSQQNVIRFSGVPTSMPTQSVSNSFSSSVMTLEKDRPLSLWLFLVSTNAGATSNFVATVRLGYGSGSLTNYATTPVLTSTVALNGTNQVVALAYFNTNQLNGARSAIIYQLQNTNVFTVNVWKILGSQFR